MREINSTFETKRETGKIRQNGQVWLLRENISSTAIAQNYASSPHILSFFSVQRSRLSFSLCFESVNAWIGKRQILKDVSGFVKHGTMMAVMGPSGNSVVFLHFVCCSKCHCTRWFWNLWCRQNNHHLVKGVQRWFPSFWRVFQMKWVLVWWDENFHCFLCCWNCHSPLEFGAAEN